ncbi:sugar phosphate isomerase/epimerase family protein [Isoptericola dokdonensis]|uniref:Xylose isomerase-like TIM barrel n=1 Tax=Isoptericola dokdonensis DS-3 TaxID=1300344 RepID=A0A168ENU7_9MICO|nr:TIM barrel protein [Isoptericola dokdonensis]ANC30281.1 Xylose isomerase-like TIM barrel [Isoptericola dokdonensis DS-3]
MCYGYDGDEALRRSLDVKDVPGPSSPSRRVLLRGALAGAAGLVVTGASAGTAAAGQHQRGRPAQRRRVPPGRISLQLWTVREGLGEPWGPGDYDATLTAVAQTGYPRIEQALGYFGRTARELRAFYREIGVRATSSHDGISDSRAALHEKLQNAVTLGQRYIVVPYLASDSLSDWTTWAEQMNTEARTARKYGLSYGYHNHAHEFTTDLGGGITPWDVLTSRLDRRYVHLEIDIYWVVTAGVNLGLSNDDAQRFALRTIRRSPLDVRQYHVKDRHTTGPEETSHADLGTGFIDFERFFRAHQVEEYIVENDTPDVTYLQTADVGYDYLRRIRF